MGTNPSYFKGDDLPVEQVSWYDAVEYCNRLSRREGLTPVYTGSGSSIRCNFSANGWRLPTEAEWEYAAKGGNKGRGYEYSGSYRIDDVAWYDSNSGGKTHIVGLKKPNDLGIYDMIGNVYEWCWDWFILTYYSRSPSSNPTGPESLVAKLRLSRGGAWDFNADICNTTYRGRHKPSYRNNAVGFRTVRTAE